MQELLEKTIDFLERMWYNTIVPNAGMMELADVLDSKSSGSDTMRVRFPLPAPYEKAPTLWVLF